MQCSNIVLSDPQKNSALKLLQKLNMRVHIFRLVTRPIRPKIPYYSPKTLFKRQKIKALVHKSSF